MVKKPKKPTLILEGTDCSGKTTLAKKIQDKWNCKYIHVLKPPDGEDKLVHFMRAINNIRQPTIIDRLHWSEEVYSRAIRDEPMNDRDFGVIDGYMYAHRGIFVLCSPPLEVILDNIENYPEGENHNIDTVTNIWIEYNKAPRTILPCIKYDYTNESAEELIQRAIKIMDMFYG